MIITTGNAGVIRGLEKLIKTPRDGIKVKVIDDGPSCKVYSVECKNALDLAHAVPSLSSETADIRLG